MIYLLDTNVVTELTTRPRPSPSVVAWAKSVPAPDLCLSVITVAEIELGIAAAADPDRRAGYRRILDGIRHEYAERIAPIGERESVAYLEIHKRLKRTGTTIDPPDALIAATALANGWTLATRNVKHLARTTALVVNPWDHEP
ncbi:type II toxin-antitoxin system VapC family toxin [Actinocorallia sp. A-T 12471]|uniref:type II toxin-antitoxin system VapC family toxin n=1 Tax=Actinocorallia sp. A-T 12471 TaxID=3089813 RepID=UPI0029D33859|nr:type II toxin-antitoxin system VapC family toxin [Actinocorallia sp. A-T 12471]MDX6744684.1 type II toxin-antitoxin system VapC family toxin [Actinocorallia sp. A-T 12471]